MLKSLLMKLMGYSRIKFSNMELYIRKPLSEEKKNILRLLEKVGGEQYIYGIDGKGNPNDIRYFIAFSNIKFSKEEEKKLNELLNELSKRETKS